MRGKIFNRIFTDAEYSFSMLIFYYEHMIATLRKSSHYFQEFTERLEIENRNRQKEFDKNYWLKHYDVYTEIYPGLFNNSFIILACALFEYQIKKVCALIEEEHKAPLEWDDMEGTVLLKTRRYLGIAGVILKDDPPRIGLSPPNFVPTEVFDKDRIIMKVFWQELENYFKVRNCIAHNNGEVERLRYPDKVIEYASRMGILVDENGQRKLSLNQVFNKEVCGTMMKFFNRLMSAYYSTPLPE